MLRVARAVVHNEYVLEHHPKFFQSRLASFKVWLHAFLLHLTVQIISPALALLGNSNDAIVAEALELLITIFDEACR